MPVKITNTFTPQSEVGAALNNAITSYINTTPTYDEVQAGRVNANKADAPNEIGAQIRALYGASGPNGQPLTPQMVQDNIAGLAQATAKGGDVGKLGDLLRVVVANAANPESVQMIDRAQQGAGQAFNTTETGFNKSEANDILKTKMQQDGAMARTRAALDAKMTDVNDPYRGLTPLQVQQRKAQDASKAELERQLDELEKLYTDLADEGGAVSGENDFITNKTNQLAASGVGQYISQGSRAQSLRNQIEARRQSMRIAIMAASGLGSKVFDSNRDLEAMLKTVSSPGMDVEANREIIRNLRSQYGSGGSSAMPVEPVGGTDVLGLFGGSENPGGSFEETLSRPNQKQGFPIRRIR